eukprot:GHVO01006383.1.p1 GENE.GHVO01006383.1~~GHVO01006383.1.p1  ORF type:complete len:132 (+),score=5.88 GHVO01006383.1:249-644(+)
MQNEAWPTNTWSDAGGQCTRRRKPRGHFARVLVLSEGDTSQSGCTMCHAPRAYTGYKMRRGGRTRGATLVASVPGRASRRDILRALCPKLWGGHYSVATVIYTVRKLRPDMVMTPPVHYILLRTYPRHEPL